jgi:hypothetical protein
MFEVHQTEPANHPSLIQFPKRENPKINPKMWHVFRGRIKAVFSPSFTSIPPQIHHQKTTICHHVFAKTPAKMPFHQPREKYVKKNNSRTEALPS